MSKKPSVELKLPILKDMELVATQTAEIVAKHMDLSEEKTGEISMALIEACINAFEHSESKSEVYIDFLIEENQLTIKVIDKGKGFDQSNVKIPKIESKLNSDERKRGWGIMLIKELMDSVDFESDHTGTTLTMIKKKEATNE
ncbi:MAG: anti-sigma regulatory factor [Flavobacteriaceae bacterium]|nr:anti-sigma regulatory factor [Flavobacteriaceae bacterium]|tara:strand:- start:87 stop:515 length:429 start_codon:yes stop_codon:yes gene_type:complete